MVLTNFVYFAESWQSPVDNQHSDIVDSNCHYTSFGFEEQETEKISEGSSRQVEKHFSMKL
jgi:hypothetical protein